MLDAFVYYAKIYAGIIDHMAQAQQIVLLQGTLSELLAIAVDKNGSQLLARKVATSKLQKSNMQKKQIIQLVATGRITTQQDNIKNNIKNIMETITSKF